MITFDIFVTVYLSSVLVAGLSQTEALGWAALGGVVAGLAVSLLRWRVPATVRPRPDVAAEPDEIEGGWDATSALMAAVVIPAWMLLGFLVRGWLLVLVVVAFALAASDPSALLIAVALACSIAVAAAAEVAVVHPLYRRWDIALD